MALQKQVVFHGVTIPAAYCRVALVSISRARNDNTIMVEVRASEDATEILDTPLHLTGYDNAMGVAEAYAYLKTLPEYQDAVDV